MRATKSSSSRSSPRIVRPREPASQALSSGRRPTRNAAEVADYVATMTAELAAMAGAARLDLLTYFLNMARLEAEFHVRHSEPPAE